MKIRTIQSLGISIGILQLNSCALWEITAEGLRDNPTVISDSLNTFNQGIAAAGGYNSASRSYTASAYNGHSAGGGGNYKFCDFCSRHVTGRHSAECYARGATDD